MTAAGIRDTLTSELLARGLALGAIALLAVVLVGRWRAASGREVPVPIAGLALVAGAMFALADTTPLPAVVILGLVLLALAGRLAQGSVVYGISLALPGAVLLALESPSEPRWIPVAVGVSAALGSVAAASFDRQYARLALGPVLFALSVFGVYLTIPETDLALTVLGVAAPMALAGWPMALARLGDGGAFASVGLLSWITATGGITRSSAVIGGLACLGVLVVEPVSRSVVTRRIRNRLVNPWVIVALHVVVVLLVARAAGLRSSRLMALLVASSTLIAAVVVTACWVGWMNRRRRDS